MPGCRSPLLPGFFIGLILLVLGPGHDVWNNSCKTTRVMSTNTPHSRCLAISSPPSTSPCHPSFLSSTYAPYDISNHIYLLTPIPKVACLQPHLSILPPPGPQPSLLPPHPLPHGKKSFCSPYCHALTRGMTRELWLDFPSMASAFSCGCLAISTQTAGLLPIYPGTACMLAKIRLTFIQLCMVFYHVSKCT